MTFSFDIVGHTSSIFSEASLSCVLFDFDMTLVDSSHAITRCLNLVAQHFGLAYLSPAPLCWRGSESPWKRPVRATGGIMMRHGWSTTVRSFGRRSMPICAPIPRCPLCLRGFGAVPLPPASLPIAGMPAGLRWRRGVADLVDCLVGLGGGLPRESPIRNPLLYALELAATAPPREALYVGDTAEDMTAASRRGGDGHRDALREGVPRSFSALPGAREVLESIEDFPPFFEALASGEGAR